MPKAPVHRIASMIVAVCTALVLGAEVLALADVESFEWVPLYALLGLRGILALTVLNVGLMVLLLRSIAGTRGIAPRIGGAGSLLIAASAVLTVWALEWMFVESPPSDRLRRHFAEPRKIVLPPREQQDFDFFSLTRSLATPDSQDALAVMYERIRLVNPRVNRAHPIASTIDRYAARYHVDPTVLFYLAYVHSFWGEAASGRVPFLGTMTAETIRDVVQIHLPSWFVESELRHYLIADDLLQRLAGDHLGFKLRYAVHKATLDVSAQPYELNMLSDVLLVLRTYPAEFGDVLADGVSDPAKLALRDAFRSVGPHALEKPYEDPYSVPAKDAAYYQANRRELKRFARAAYYATVLDFDLATRIAALLVDYQKNRYVASLGQDTWEALPAYQKAAMLTMTRDVYVPSIGRPAYNRYALPEMNCTPIAFVSESARADPDLATSSVTHLWRPKDYGQLWGGAGTKLRVFSEVWSVAHGQPFPGLEPEQTTPDARAVVLVQQAP